MEQDHEESRRMTILCLCIGLILLGTALFVFDPFSLREEEKTCYTRTSLNFNFLVFFEFLIEFLIGFPD